MFKGSMVALVTPFKNGRVDGKEWKREQKPEGRRAVLGRIGPGDVASREPR